MKRTIEEIIKLSDDIEQHLDLFTRVTKRLIWDLHLTKKDVTENGGWVRSTSYEDSYFITKFGGNFPFKIYLDIDKKIVYIFKNNMKKIILNVKNLEKPAVKMPHMRPVPILTNGLPRFKALWVWVKSIRKWEITEDWYFFIEYLNIWIMIPKGFIFDGASIPKLLRNLFSPVGILFLPGLLHDYGYRFGHLLVNDNQGIYPVLNDFTRNDWDKLFRNVAVQINGFKYLNKGPYAGLFVGGWATWKKHRKNNLIEPLLEKKP